MNMFEVFHEQKSEQTFEAARQAKEAGLEMSEATLNGRVQVVLAQKRTSLSVLRTGIGLLTLPMTIAVFLISTSKMWDPMHNLWLLVPLFALNTGLVILGVWLIHRAWTKIRNFDKTIDMIKAHAKSLGHFVP